MKALVVRIAASLLISSSSSSWLEAAESGDTASEKSRGVPSRSGHPAVFTQSGLASWYAGTPSRGGKSIGTAAHRHLPLGTFVRVTNLANQRSAIVLITDRGPFVKGRIIDVNKRAATELAMLKAGTARVRLEVVSTP